jgi:hypothetical protein
MQSDLHMSTITAHELFRGVECEHNTGVTTFKITKAVYEGTPLTPIKLSELELIGCRLVKFEATPEPNQSHRLEFEKTADSVNVTMLDKSVVSLPVAQATIVLAEGICGFLEGIIAAKTTIGYTVCIPTQSKFFVVLIYKNPAQGMPREKRRRPERKRKEPERFGDYKRW